MQITIDKVQHLYDPVTGVIDMDANGKVTLDKLRKFNPLAEIILEDGTIIQEGVGNGS